MKTLFISKTNSTMKTIKLFLLLVVSLCVSLSYATPPPACGVGAMFGYKFNPSNFVEFKDSSNVIQGWQILSYKWDLGNGQTSTVQNPSIFYSTPGNYNVCLIVAGKSTVAGTNITCSDTFCRTVTVTPCNTLYIGFQNLIQGGVVTFTSFVSTNAVAPVSYNWNFGDGTSSQDPNPVHTYIHSGTYNVCLAVEDANGCRAERCQQISVTIPNSVPCGLDAYFGKQSVASSNLSVQFIDSSKVAPGWLINHYQWTFGDGTSSTLQNPIHAYSTSGTYNVCLIISGENPSIPNAHCSDTICKSITTNCNSVSGNYTWIINGPSVAFQQNFSSNYPPMACFWNFGDGSATSSGPNPTHVYANPGTYNVCVYARDSSFCYFSVCHNIIIPFASCGNVNATFTISSTGLNGAVVLQSTTPGVPAGTLYQWWMDGQTLTNPNPNTSFTITNVARGITTFAFIFM
ncbi:MAG: PKD domain-containing protein [Bacteroidetes bacterium]|nr:PKD domain-containing protein [Bacteroidota bacterium]